MHRIYLAGGISGLTYDEATDWRKYVKEELISYDIESFSPMRAKEYLVDEPRIKDSYEDKVLSCDRGITVRDRFDLQRSDLVFVNLLGAKKKVSIGTVMEIAWADILRKPIVLCIEDEGNLHDHGMIRDVIGFRVPDLKSGIKIVKAVLLA
jgi:nucleoside 2-deoxyribosyltransferase